MVHWLWVPLMFTMGGFIGAAIMGTLVMTGGVGREVELQKVLQANKVQES
jgi:hypothetical protein